MIANTLAVNEVTSSAHEHPDIRLFDLLQEAVSVSRQEVLVGDLDAAMASLDEYVRAQLRSGGQQSVEDLDPQLDFADHLLERRFSLGWGNQPVDLGTPVDWKLHYDRDACWNGHMGSMYGFAPLARAYAATREERYAEAWCGYVVDFLDAMWYGNPTLSYFLSRPMALNDTKSCDNGECDWESPSHWISLGAAQRADSWLECCALLADSPALSRELLWRILRSLYEDHYLILVNNPRTNTPNQVLHTSATLLRLGLALPAMRNASACFLIGYQRLTDAIESQMYPDGTDLEQSPNYNWALPTRITEVLALLKDAPESRKTFFREAAKRRIRYLCHACTPDLGMLDLAKAHHDDNLGPWLMKNGTDFNVPEAIWLASYGLEGSPPSFHSVAMPYSAYYAMRSGYELDSDYLFFKASMRGAGHMSEDSLGLIIASSGRRLLVDSGTYSYTNATALDLGMNQYSAHSISHSVVLIDGQGQARMDVMRREKPNGFDSPLVTARGASKLPNRAFSGNHFEYAEGFYTDGFGPGATIPCSHTRRIFWIKDRGWLVVDLLEAPGDQIHEYTILWMLGPDFANHCAIRDGGVHTTATGINLSVTPLIMPEHHTTIHCGKDDPMLGWYTVNYGRRVPKPDIHTTWIGSGRQIVGTWLQTDSRPAIRQTRTSFKSDRLHIELDFVDGAEFSADMGFDATYREIRGLTAEAESMILWKQGDVKKFALVGDLKHRYLKDHPDIEGVISGDTTTASSWRKMPELG